MLSVFQINATANSGSTGRIAEQINLIAQKHGWKTFIAYGRKRTESQSYLIRVGSIAQVYEHYLEHRVFDNDGLASRMATRRLVQRITAIKPDIIHLNNIHDHWVNYRILFESLNLLGIPVVWTLHDCWPFTGGCPHFVSVQCQRWKNGTCGKGCPLKRRTICRRFFEKTRRHFELKQSLFTANKDLTIVPVSYWLEGFVSQSFLKDKRIQTIHNGVDLAVFRPTVDNVVLEKYGLAKGRYVIGVANVWDESKGINDFIKLSRLLSPETKIVLVGNKRGQVKSFPSNIVDVPFTESVGELAALYSSATLFVNFTYEDNYPSTNLEAMACGTPVLTYRTGGSPEAVTPATGWVIEQGDITGVAKIVESLQNRDESERLLQRKACRTRAETEFDKGKCFEAYLELYESLLK